ncbi:MAG: hypothetical protein RLY14_389 [Planctomycetota bacterium]|jgi:hypothetical protein
MLSSDAWKSFTRIEKTAVLALLFSGLGHIPFLFLRQVGWEDPVSFRKPILFGISGGLTLWSLLYVIHLLGYSKRMRFVSKALIFTLIPEVALITFQTWRGVPSHFNDSGMVNSSIEVAMLLLILIATAMIFWLTYRVFHKGALASIAPAMKLALQAGLVYLAVSCAIGIAITAIGKQQIASGGTAELYRGNGVLKFPHGIAIHAIQTLAFLAWCCQSLSGRWAWRAVMMAAIAHLFLLAYATIQTAEGRARFETSYLTSALLLFALAPLVLSLAIAAKGLFTRIVYLEKR